jgi:ubiquinone/menaquinone biosynthesis C-methylase UbiE
MDKFKQYFMRYPITSPAYNVAKIAGGAIRENASKYFSGQLLDIGCGDKHKALLVEEFVQKYYGLDHPITLHDQTEIDIFGTANNIPCSNSSFDSVICTAVLEHLEEPQAAVREAFRVLKPGGVALFTAPLFWHLHEEPRDFFRYTEYGLKYLFISVNFKMLELIPLSGFWVTIGTMWSYYLKRYRRGLLKYLIDAIIIINNRIFPFFDRIFFRNEKFTWMYLVIAQKPNK